MLHVWRFPVCVHATNGRGGGRRRISCTSCRVVQPRIEDREVLLIWRINTNDLFRETDQELFMIDAVTGANRSAALAERIPGETDAWCEVTVRRSRNLISKRGRSWSTVHSGSDVLRIDKHSIAEVAGAGDAIACPSHLRRIGGRVKSRIEIRQATVSVIRLSETRVT